MSSPWVDGSGRQGALVPRSHTTMSQPNQVAAGTSVALLGLSVLQVAPASPRPTPHSPCRPAGQRRRGRVHRLGKGSQIAVVDESAVDLVGELVQRCSPGGPLRQDLDLDLTSDRDADLDLDQALDHLLSGES